MRPRPRTSSTTSMAFYIRPHIAQNLRSSSRSISRVSRTRKMPMSSSISATMATNSANCISCTTCRSRLCSSISLATSWWSRSPTTARMYISTPRSTSSMYRKRLGICTSAAISPRKNGSKTAVVGHCAGRMLTTTATSSPFFPKPPD